MHNKGPIQKFNIQNPEENFCHKNSNTLGLQRVSNTRSTLEVLYMNKFLKKDQEYCKSGLGNTDSLIKTSSL